MRLKAGLRTTAAVGVVVFLLTVLVSGCCSERCEKRAAGSDRPERRHRKAGNYSKIPSNYPADWQTAAGGH